MIQLDQLENMLGAHQWVSVLDQHGRILAVNEAVEKMTGTAREQWLGQEHAALQVKSMSPASSAALWENLRAGQSWSGVLRTRQRQGAGLLTDVLLQPFQDPQGTQFILDLRNDISLLHASVGQPSSDVGGDDALLLCNASGRIQSFNRAAAMWWPTLMAGQSLDNLLCSFDSLLARWVPQIIAEQCSGQGAMVSHEVGSLTSASGQRRAVRLAVSSRWNREVVLHVHVGAVLSGSSFRAMPAPDPSRMLLGQLLSRRLDSHPGLSIHRQSGSTFSGDILTAAWSPTGTYYLCLGDATGSGLEAALSALPALEAFNCQVDLAQPLENVVRAMNRAQRDSDDRSRFLAATVLSINPESKTLRYWCAGLPAGAYYRSGDAEAKLLTSNHLPLGVLESSQFDDTCETVYWSESLRLALCSDGFSEAMPTETWLETWAGAPADQSFDAVMQHWQDTLELHSPRHDDVSFIHLLLK